MSREIQAGQIWRSETGSRFRVVSLTLGHTQATGKVTVERLRPRPKWEDASNGRYVWAPETFAAMTQLETRPCPACGVDCDPTYIPPPRVPLDIRCACCCQ